MTTCRDIITQALYRVKVTAVGDEPEAEIAESGLFMLQDVYDSYFASGHFGELNDVYAGADYTALENDRVVSNGFTITRPTTFEEDGVLRTIKDLTPLQVDSARFIWEGAWTPLDGLTLSSAAPLADKGAGGLSCFLAMRWAGTFGGELTADIVRRGRQFNSIILGANNTAAEPVESY